MGAFVFPSMHACTQVCMCMLLSRHICLALISFAWHRDQAVSLVFNNSIDTVHLSRSECSFRITHSFGPNHLKAIMFLLFYDVRCEQVVSLHFGKCKIEKFSPL